MERLLGHTRRPRPSCCCPEGVVLERDAAEVSWLGPAAARGQIVAVRPAARIRRLRTPSRHGRRRPAAKIEALAEEGLATLAGLARGSVFRVTSTADSAFSRLALELSGYYLLSFEPEPAIGTARPTRSRSRCRAGRASRFARAHEFTVGRGTRSGKPESILADAIRAPLLSTDIGLKATAYTFSGRRDRQAADRLRRGDRSHPSRATGPTRARLHAHRRARTARDQPARAGRQSARCAPTTKTQTYVGSVLTDTPGAHTLKLAVVDDTGKRGSVEHTFRAQITSAGQLRVDGSPASQRTRARSEPVGWCRRSSATSRRTRCTATSSCTPRPTEPLAERGVAFEVADSEAGARHRFGAGAHSARRRRRARRSDGGRRRPDRAAAAGRLRRARGRQRRRAQGGDDLPALPNRRGPLTSPARPGDGRASAPARARRFPFTSRIDAFERTSVLTPQVVGFFLDRMTRRTPACRRPAPAIADARAGKFDEAVAALAGAGQRSAARRCSCSGLALVLEGRARSGGREVPRVAAHRFRVPPRGVLPRSVLRGRRQAIAKRPAPGRRRWSPRATRRSSTRCSATRCCGFVTRTRRSTSSRKPRTLWPDNEQVQLRLGTALRDGRQRRRGGAGRSSRTSPGTRRTTSGCSWRCGSSTRRKSAGQPIVSAQEDQALFERYAAAYAAAGGPSRPSSTSGRSSCSDEVFAPIFGPHGRRRS